jgi:pimeloyl-ACP methyl ester carboxylesterase
MNLRLTLFLVAASVAAKTVKAILPYKTNIFNQKLDHFNPLDDRTWNHRYLTNDQYWNGSGKLENGCKGPILLYTGNEGPITAFWGSNGFMQDVLAPKFGAMVVFPEERYYGESLPFGNQTFNGDPKNLQFLTTHQVLADYANLVTSLKEQLKAQNCPVIAFGGSYGGTLTTLFRLTYPNIVDGGLAASAPVGYYDPKDWDEHGVTEFTWADIAARDYHDADPQCMSTIQAARTLIDNTDVDSLLALFNVCDASGLGPTLKSDLFSYALESMPQLDYPDTSPPWPVNDTCTKLIQGKADGKNAFLTAAATITKRVLGIPFDNDGSNCMKTLAEGPGGFPGDGPGGISAWSFQSCTETLHTFSSSISRGHIRDWTFDMKTKADDPCQKLFQHSPDTNFLASEFGGYKISSNKAGVTNLIWSNGGFDPWHGGGFYPDGVLPNSSTPLYRTEDDASRGIHYIWIRRGAHHGDLRGPSKMDPQELSAARTKEVEIITDWIQTAGSL